MPRRLLAVLTLLVVGVLGAGVTTALVRSGDDARPTGALPQPNVTTSAPSSGATDDPGTLPSEEPTPEPTADPAGTPTPAPTGTTGSGGSTTPSGTATPPPAPITPQTGGSPVVPVAAALVLGIAVATRLTRETACAPYDA